MRIRTLHTDLGLLRRSSSSADLEAVRVKPN